MTTTTTSLPVETSTRSPGKNLPQRMGSRLWAPMLLMAIVAFPVGVVLSWVRAAEIAGDADAETVAVLGHLVPAFMFLGFTAVFSAISFAIARILGEFRAGGGDVQEAAGRSVQTLKMPTTGKLFMLGMAMAMMTLLVAVILHFVAAGAISGSSSALADSEQWAIWLEGVRRVAVAVYLFAIAFGLATIINVIGFQSRRIQELPNEPTTA